jgi:hypothetical protein
MTKDDPSLAGFIDKTFELIPLGGGLGISSFQSSQVTAQGVDERSYRSRSFVDS